MLLVGASGIPLSIDIESANINEVQLIERLIERRVLKETVPQRLVYDKAADSNPPRGRLMEQDIDLISPNRKGRKYGPMQDQRKVRRYRPLVADTDAAGLGNARSAGFTTSDALSFGTNTMHTCSRIVFSLLPSSRF